MSMLVESVNKLNIYNLKTYIKNKMKPIQFDHKKTKEFYETLKSRVKEYFEKNKISDKGNRKLYFKAVLLFLSWVGAYALILFVADSIWAVI
jgi:linoleoyl-CoA desaturase